MDAVVRYAILGTVRALRGETVLEVGPPKRLALLSLLLLRAPGPLTLSEAVDVLWDGDPPASAVNVVHRHIGALRRAVEPELRSRTKAEHLVRAADGYRLLVDTSTSDLLRFRDLRTRAQLAVRTGESAGGAQLFLQALQLWRGPVAAGTPVAQHPVFVSVDHEFVAAVKEATDVVLTAMPESAEEILTALRRAVDCHPFDEALHERIIAALAATGRQAEALRQFETIRHVLAEELGVEPGPGLRAARQHLLQRTVSRKPSGPTPLPQTGPAPHTDDVPVLAQLPADCVVFAGRDAAVEQCMQLLPAEGGHHPPTTAVICGMPGVGKTTLAVHVAHQAAHRFPDGQIHLDLQGHHPTRHPLDTHQAMHDILDTLGTSRHRTHTSATALTALYRSTLARRRLLILLDDARDCEQVRPLLPTTSQSLTLITSRRRLEGLAVTHNTHILPLSPMTRKESLQLLDQRIGTHRTCTEPTATTEIADLCAGLPLALALTATRAQTNPTFSLTALATHLRTHTDTLTPFASPDPHTDTRHAFTRTYQTLTPGAATLFRHLAHHSTTDITFPTATTLTANDSHTTYQHLAELTDHHLLIEHTPGHYTCHPLLHTYATELTHDHGTPTHGPRRVSLVPELPVPAAV